MHEDNSPPQNLRLVFMGTPEFAVPSLKALLDAGFDIAGVVTAPDKPAGRGLKLTESAVKKFAVENNLHILQPVKLKDPAFIEELRGLYAHLQVVVAFRMLPEAVWNMPPMGTINLHASLLPQYRGAAPINWAIINGENETGLTTFKLKHEIDTGDILLQERILIEETTTAGKLHDIMKEAGAALLAKTVKGLAEGTLHETPQSHLETGVELKHAPKLNTANCTIDWNKRCNDVYNLIRGLSPYPGALTTLNGKLLKVYSSTKEEAVPPYPAGQPVTDDKTFLKFACSDGYIHVTDLQLEGKKRMSVEEFLRGYRLNQK